MGTDNNNKIKALFEILLGGFAIFAIKSIFEDDSSKIISKKGRKFLSDDKKMEALNKKLHNSEETNPHKEIFV